MSRSWSLFISLVTALFLGVFFLWPLIQTLAGGMMDQGRFTTVFLIEVIRNPIYLEGLWNSFTLAVATTAIVVLIGLPPAVLAARYDFPGKTWLSGLILLPMVLPPFVGAIGIQQILGQYGMLNAVLVKLGIASWSHPFDWLGSGRFWVVAVTEALHLYPVFYLNAAAAVANVDPAMDEAAENLGCAGWRKFRRITLPLIMPGLFAGGTIVFIWAFTELGTPLMLDYTRVTAVQIYDGIKDIGANPFPYALAIVMLTASLVIYGISRCGFGGMAYGTMSKGARGGTLKPLSARGAAAAWALFLIVTLAASLPHIGVCLTSFSQGWYQTVLPAHWTTGHFATALGHEMTVPSIRNSLFYSGFAMTIDILLGIAVAYVVTRSTVPWRGLLDTITMMPLAVPGIIVAFGYVAMSQPGRMFAFLNPAEDPTALLIIAYAIRRLPYVVRAVAAGLQQTTVDLEEAAQNLGCPPARTVVRITLPLISANLIAGGLLVFSFSMLEVSDSLMLAQKQVYFPITKALYELAQLLGDGRYVASAMGVWAMVFLALTMLAANMLLGKRLGTIFRL